MGTEDLPLDVAHRLAALGLRIRTARQLRGWTIAQTAARAGLNRNTVGALERGKPGVAIGAYAAVLWALGLDRTLESVAGLSEDAHGRALEASRRPQRVRRRAVAKSLPDSP
jgi:transcriptional regulator with XRE-family HTH domain